MSEPKPRDFNELFASLDHLPLFMRSLPEDGGESNEALSALQSLVHDGTPDEIATNFKEQGNDYYRGKRYKEAVGFYTQGIDAEPEDSTLLEALLCNRAACNLELKNFGMVLKDCSKALGLNPRSSKAFYRSAAALKALERYVEALDCCDLCLDFDPENAALRSLREGVVKLKEKKDKAEAEKKERLRKEKEEKRLLGLAFKERHLFVVPPAPNAAPSPYTPHFDPEDPTRQTLIVPVFFLYPQHAQSDAIPFFVETTTFQAHIETMFPPASRAPDWDTQHQYTEDNLVIYAITRRKRLLKVGRKMTLRQVFDNAGKDKEGVEDWVEVKEGCVSVVVLPKGAEERKWIEEFKSSRGN